VKRDEYLRFLSRFTFHVSEPRFTFHSSFITPSPLDISARPTILSNPSPARIGPGDFLGDLTAVAHSISAKKRIRQNIKRRANNRARKVQIKDQIKSFTSALTGGDFTKAETELRQVVRRLDKVAAKGTIHKNTAARKRSRLARRLNVARAAKASGGAGTSAARA
jgi:small subunit ribosomal protein S20